MGYIPGLGDGQQLVGAQMVLAAMGRNGTKKRRKKTKAAATKRRTKKKRVGAAKKTKRPARLVKGSAAAKRYMASIRKRRK